MAPRPGDLTHSTLRVSADVLDRLARLAIPSDARLPERTRSALFREAVEIGIAVLEARQSAAIEALDREEREAEAALEANPGSVGARMRVASLTERKVG